MKVLVTGAEGFIGRNLTAHLAQRRDIEEIILTRRSSNEDLAVACEKVDFICHLAGVNRPETESEFTVGNRDLTRRVCEAARASGRRISVLLSSSIQADGDSAYGISKREAEQALLEYQATTGSLVHIFRLPNVFGKWCRPNYNSAVATFCHNIARDLPIQVDDPAAPLLLVHVDDVVARFVEVMDGRASEESFCEVTPTYRSSVGAVADKIRAFRASRENLIIDAVGAGLTRALYATYVSYLPPESFSYEVPRYGDARGDFAEMLKTKDSGQLSFFTAYPGITRGGHYHHSKTEKFLVVRGEARFRFRHIVTGECREILTSGNKSEVVESVPGWAHDITNVGNDEMIVMLWANEIFDRARPDTFACRV